MKAPKGRIGCAIILRLNWMDSVESFQRGRKGRFAFVTKFVENTILTRFPSQDAMLAYSREIGGTEWMRVSTVTANIAAETTHRRTSHETDGLTYHLTYWPVSRYVKVPKRLDGYALR
jgi:hypothetical protein